MSLGLGVPLLGMLVTVQGYAAAFATGGTAALLALLVAFAVASSAKSRAG